MLDKNILSIIAKFSDNQTALNILKCFTCFTSFTANDIYYFNVFNFKYPDLIQFKKDKQSYKIFYTIHLKYIELLWKIYHFKYKNENPILLYGFRNYGIENENIHELLVRGSRWEQIWRFRSSQNKFRS